MEIEYFIPDGDEDWGPVNAKSKGWLLGQSVFCLLTPFGPLDIFLSLPGISNYAAAMDRSNSLDLELGLQIRLISARDLLECQLALPEIYRKPDRIHYLRGVFKDDC